MNKFDSTSEPRKDASHKFFERFMTLADSNFSKLELNLIEKGFNNHLIIDSSTILCSQST